MLIFFYKEQKNKGDVMELHTPEKNIPIENDSSRLLNINQTHKPLDRDILQRFVLNVSHNQQLIHKNHKMKSGFLLNRKVTVLALIGLISFFSFLPSNPTYEPRILNKEQKQNMNTTHKEVTPDSIRPRVRQLHQIGVKDIFTPELKKEIGHISARANEIISRAEQIVKESQATALTNSIPKSSLDFE